MHHRRNCRRNARINDLVTCTRASQQPVPPDPRLQHPRLFLLLALGCREQPPPTILLRVGAGWEDVGDPPFLLRPAAAAAPIEIDHLLRCVPCRTLGSWFPLCHTTAACLSRGVRVLLLRSYIPSFAMLSAIVPLRSSRYTKRRALVATRVCALRVDVRHSFLGGSTAELPLRGSRYPKRRLFAATLVCAPLRGRRPSRARRRVACYLLPLAFFEQVCKRVLLAARSCGRIGRTLLQIGWERRECKVPQPPRPVVPSLRTREGGLEGGLEGRRGRDRSNAEHPRRPSPASFFFVARFVGAGCFFDSLSITQPYPR